MKRTLFLSIALVIAINLNAQQTGIFTDPRDGKTYKTVKIGNQVWMAENLNYNTGIGSWCYDNNSSNCNKYGVLYNWTAAMDGEASSTTNPSGIQGVCPAGWHLPSDAEWTELTDYLGGASVAGGKLKETGTTHWNSPNTGATNETGFTALPGGGRDSDGAFYSVGDLGYWWCATEVSTDGAWGRAMGSDGSSVVRYDGDKELGFSVRCLRD